MAAACARAPLAVTSASGSFAPLVDHHQHLLSPTSTNPTAPAKAVAQMRKIGLDWILYGSDGPVMESATPLAAWKRTKTLPLTEEELRIIAGNVAPYLR